MAGWGFGMEYQMLVWGIAFLGVIGISVYLLVNLLMKKVK